MRTGTTWRVPREVIRDLATSMPVDPSTLGLFISGTRRSVAANLRRLGWPEGRIEDAFEFAYVEPDRKVGTTISEPDAAGTAGRPPCWPGPGRHPRGVRDRDTRGPPGDVALR